MEFNDKIKQFSERVVKIKDTALTAVSYTHLTLPTIA